MSKNQKQHTPEFEDCITRIMKQGHEKGSAFAICTDAFEKAQKPIFVGESEVKKLHLFSESIKLEGRKVSGVCIHPKRIFHPEDDLTHVYLKEELMKAAPTLTGKPFGIDHMYVLPPPNIITRSWYDSIEDGVAYEGIVDDEIAKKITDKEFKGVSIEVSWLRPGGKVEFMNGVAPRNFELTSVHLLRRFPPGDSEAYIKFWNAITEQLVGVGSPRTIDDRVEALELGLKEIRTTLEVIEGKLNMLSATSVSPQATPPAPTEPKNRLATIPLLETALAKAKKIKGQGMTKDQILQRIEELQRQILENERKLYPESALALEEKERVRTENSQLYTELEAYRQALAELIKQQVQQEPVDAVAVRKDLVETQAKLACAEKRAKAEKEKFARFHEAVKGTLPDRATELRWLGTGPKLFTEKVKRVLHDFTP